MGGWTGSYCFESGLCMPSHTIVRFRENDLGSKKVTKATTLFAKEFQ